MKATSTFFYIAGTEHDLWPTTLNRTHIGPKFCGLSPLHMDFKGCLYSSWTILGAAMNPRSMQPTWNFSIPGGPAYEFPPASLVFDNLPLPKES